MSVASIPAQIRLKLWIAAGGRCEYPGCNIPLYRDDVTMAELNRSYIAHIVADSSDGPRGDEALSPLLAKEFSNLMLLCDTHHRLIDVEDIEGHTVELLQQFKREHEERIELLTGIDSTRKTYVVMYGANIGQRDGLISFEQARAAVVPARYPSTNCGIALDMTQNAATDNDPDFWTTECKNIDGFVASRLSGSGPDGKPMEHLSIFALAPIPLLIYFGKALGDIVSMDLYQRHRDTESWQWQDSCEPDFNYTIDKPDSESAHGSDVILELSLSDTIDQDGIHRVMPGEAPWYRITIDRPNRDFLKTRTQLELFAREYGCLLSEIRDRVGADCKIYLFPAIPASIAIQIGRMVLPKSDAPVLVYDFNRSCDGWMQVLTL